MVLNRRRSLGPAAVLIGVLCAFAAVSRFDRAAFSAPQVGTRKGAESRAALNRQCVEAVNRAARDAEAMVPHRFWTWRLDFERTRRDLAQLRRDLTALHDTEAGFEATLTGTEREALRAERGSVQQLWSHLESDADSLDTELRKGYPTRWHVARDASDMETEIRRLKRVHERMAREVGLQR